MKLQPYSMVKTSHRVSPGSRKEEMGSTFDGRSRMHIQERGGVDGGQFWRPFTTHSELGTHFGKRVREKRCFNQSVLRHWLKEDPFWKQH